MTTTALSNGFLLSLSLCMDIGIVNVALLTLAMQRGFLPSFWFGLGSCFGDLIYATLALVGMLTLLQFTPVRWIIWIGGSLVLLFLMVKMTINAFSAPPESFNHHTDRSHHSQFVKGMLMAMSSPSAILWFAAVGGALIAQSTDGSWETNLLFLSAFFSAGLIWTLGLCFVGHNSGKLAGQKILKYCYVGSAILFAYFAYKVILEGYENLWLANGS